jgi:hypothetical protein
LSGAPYTQGNDRWRGLEIHYDANGVPDGGWELDRSGRIVAFGSAPALSVQNLPRAPVYQQLHGNATAGAIVQKFGVTTIYGSGFSPYWTGYQDDGSADLLRDVALVGADNPTPIAQPVSAAAMAAYQSWVSPHGGGADLAEVTGASFAQDARTPTVLVHVVNHGQAAEHVQLTAVCWDGAATIRGGGSRSVMVGPEPQGHDEAIPVAISTQPARCDVYGISLG